MAFGVFRFDNPIITRDLNPVNKNSEKSFPAPQTLSKQQSQRPIATLRISLQHLAAKTPAK
jgi:hypothetical protein